MQSVRSRVINIEKIQNSIVYFLYGSTTQTKESKLQLIRTKRPTSANNTAKASDVYAIVVANKTTNYYYVAVCSY